MRVLKRSSHRTGAGHQVRTTAEISKEIVRELCDRARFDIDRIQIAENSLLRENTAAPSGDHVRLRFRDCSPGTPGVDRPRRRRDTWSRGAGRSQAQCAFRPRSRRLARSELQAVEMGIEMFSERPHTAPLSCRPGQLDGEQIFYDQKRMRRPSRPRRGTRFRSPNGFFSTTSLPAAAVCGVQVRRHNREGFTASSRRSLSGGRLYFDRPSETRIRGRSAMGERRRHPASRHRPEARAPSDTESTRVGEIFFFHVRQFLARRSITQPHRGGGSTVQSRSTPPCLPRPKAQPSTVGPVRLVATCFRDGVMKR